MKKLLTSILIGLMVLVFASPVFAYEQGTDWAIYQGASGKAGYPSDTFTFSQIGGVTSRGTYDQNTYESQVQSGLSKGLRTHSYIWYETGGDSNLGKLALDKFLPNIKTPKGSIVALDYEAGAGYSIQANTNAVMYGLNRIKQAGYTPMLYTGKYYANAHLNILQINSAFPNSLWIAGYPDYQIRSQPLDAYKPIMDGLAIWQFTSTYKAGGLDGNVDYTGITKNGYENKPVAPVVQSGIDVDGYAGRATVKAMQRVLGTPQDGYVSGQSKYSKQFVPKFTTVQLGNGGSQMVYQLQLKLGVKADGYLGYNTIRALQSRLHVYADGYAGVATIKALQNNLNKGYVY